MCEGQPENAEIKRVGGWGGGPTHPSFEFCTYRIQKLNNLVLVTRLRRAECGEGAEAGAAEDGEEDSNGDSYNAPYEFLVAVGELESDWDDSDYGSTTEISQTYEHAWL
jgi:hypothetical protein